MASLHALIVFVRFPYQGKVKTRLAQSIGTVQASQFYRLCAEAALQEITLVSGTIDRYVFYADETDELEIRHWVGCGFQCIVQQGKDIGERLQSAFYHVFEKGTRKIVIVASDVPDLSHNILEQAMKALDRADVVLGPCYDGGYYLIGMKKLHEDLFNGILWSTEQVYQQTVDIATGNGLTVHQLPCLIDIDTQADLQKWARTDKYRKPVLEEFIATVDLKAGTERVSP